MAAPIYVLGGYQTDFARNWTKENKHIVGDAARGGAGRPRGDRHRARRRSRSATSATSPPSCTPCRGISAPSWSTSTRPSPACRPSRHEAACASGSIAILAASAEIEAGRYDLALVVGVEQMKTVDPKRGGDFLGTAAWYEREAKGIEFPFPKLFGRLGDEYDKRFGLKDEHLAHISAVNYSNAKRNPLAQTRSWYMTEDHACATRQVQQLIGGRIKVSDCSQVTDGAVSLFLASEKCAQPRTPSAAASSSDRIPQLLGWGHHTAPIEFTAKVAESRDNPYVLPHTRQTILDAFKRAGVEDCWGVRGDRDARLLHHLRVHGDRPLRSHQARRVVEGGRGRHDRAGRQAADQPERRPDRLPAIRSAPPARARCSTPTSRSPAQRGDYQVDGAKRIATLNIGGSGTTSVCFVVGN